MKFKIRVASYFYNKQDKEELEKLGFKFTLYEPRKDSGEPYVVENYSRVEDWSEAPEIEIESLEELLTFYEKWGEIVFDSGKILII